jgi:CDP-diacylglycerol pyrophosphatase
MRVRRSARRGTWLGLVALSALGLLILSTFPAGAQSAPNRNILWEIVRDCVDMHAAGYCTRCTRPVSGMCPTPTTCRSGTEVWAITEEFVAIRDIKMCGCAAPFLHGLALPRAKVAGLESPEHPPGIWSFAWNVAVSRIGRPEDVALVVNGPPPQQPCERCDHRTQDQLHVHLIRLSPGARERLAAGQPVLTTRLDAVSEIAATLATARKLPTYGVLVVQARPDEFLVEVSKESFEKPAFTVATCPSR